MTANPSLTWNCWFAYREIISISFLSVWTVRSAILPVADNLMCQWYDQKNGVCRTARILQGKRVKSFSFYGTSLDPNWTQQNKNFVAFRAYLCYNELDKQAATTSQPRAGTFPRVFVAYVINTPCCGCIQIRPLPEHIGYVCFSETRHRKRFPYLKYQTLAQAPIAQPEFQIHGSLRNHS